MFIVYIIKSKIKMSGGYKRTHENGYDKRKKKLYISKQSGSICKFLISPNITF